MVKINKQIPIYKIIMKKPRYSIEDVKLEADNYVRLVKVGIMIANELADLNSNLKKLMRK